MASFCEYVCCIKEYTKLIKMKIIWNYDKMINILVIKINQYIYFDYRCR